MSLLLGGIFGVIYILLLIIGILFGFTPFDHIIIGVMYWVLAIILWRVIEGRKWKVNVIIKERRGDTVVRIHDKYKRVKKDGEEWGELRKKRARIRPIPYRFIEADEKGKYWAELFSPSAGEFHPMRMNRKTLKMTAKIDPYFVNWTFNESQKAREKWRKESALSNLIKFLPIIIIVVCCTLMLVIYMDQLLKITEPILATSQSSQEALRDAARALDEMNHTITGLQKVGVIPYYDLPRDGSQDPQNQNSPQQNPGSPNVFGVPI